MWNIYAIHWFYHNISTNITGKCYQFLMHIINAAVCIIDAYRSRKLLFTEGLAVGALIHSRVGFVGAYKDTVQGAVVCLITVICALRNGTLDALICFAIHFDFLLFL